MGGSPLTYGYHRMKWSGMWTNSTSSPREHLPLRSGVQEGNVVAVKGRLEHYGMDSVQGRLLYGSLANKAGQKFELYDASTWRSARRDARRHPTHRWAEMV